MIGLFLCKESPKDHRPTNVPPEGHWFKSSPRYQQFQGVTEKSVALFLFFKEVTHANTHTVPDHYFPLWERPSHKRQQDANTAETDSPFPQEL